MAGGAVVLRAGGRGVARLGADVHIHLRSRHPTGVQTDRGAMVTLSGMELLVVLLIIVLAFSGWLILRHFTRPAQKPEPGRKPSAVITLTRPDGSTDVRDVRPNADGGSFDEWVAEQQEKARRIRSGGPAKIAAVHLEEGLTRVDLRGLPSSRFRIVGTAHWVTDAERRTYSAQEYELVREPNNEHDTRAVAVYGRGRKVGYLSAAKAAGLAPELDRLGEAAFVVGGDSVTEHSIRMWVDIPRLPALRAFRAN